MKRISLEGIYERRTTLHEIRAVLVSAFRRVFSELDLDLVFLLQPTTILNAYLKSENEERWISERTYSRYFRQRDVFRIALLRRIEAGDRAREALRMIIDKELRGWTEHDPDRDVRVMSDIARSALAGGDN